MLHISSATTKNCFALSVFVVSLQGVRLLLDHSLAITSTDETSPDRLAIAHKLCTQGPWASWWPSFQFLIILFDLESPEQDVSFQVGPHIHQLRRKAASLDPLIMFLLMIIILLKLGSENIYIALESSTVLLAPFLGFGIPMARRGRAWQTGAGQRGTQGSANAGQ